MSKYPIAQKVNKEVMRLAPLMLKLTSQSVHHTDPNMISAWRVPTEDIVSFYGLDNYFVTEISGGDMVYGIFTDDEEQTYIMFVNKDWAKGHDFKIKLNPSRVMGLQRIDKDTIKPVPVDTPDHTLSLRLEAGDGELFKVLLHPLPW
jgi:hypothetical protein